jgi:hypothetical protein
MDHDRIAGFVIIVGVAIGLLIHWVVAHDDLSIVGGIFFLTFSTWMLPSLVYHDDARGEKIMAFLLQIMVLLMLIAATHFELLPIYWLPFMLIGSVRVLYMAYKEMQTSNETTE